MTTRLSAMDILTRPFDGLPDQSGIPTFDYTTDGAHYLESDICFALANPVGAKVDTLFARAC